MKRIVSLLVMAAILLSGCSKSSKTDDYSLKVLTPTGAPAVASIPLSNQGFDVSYDNGGTNIQAALINPTPEYDVIIAPVNLGVTLISKGSTTYRLHSVVTWGNLYLVESTKEGALNNLALFGENAVPGKVFESVKSLLALSVDQSTYYASVSEAQQVLMSGQAKYALLAEPLVTASIAKAKQSGFEISIAKDVQSLWKEKNGDDNYPQAGIFVEETIYDEHKTAVDAAVKSMGDYLTAHETLESDIDRIGVEKLGVPSSAIIKSAWDRMNLKVVSAKDSSAQLTNFLSLFNIEWKTDFSSK